MLSHIFSKKNKNFHINKESDEFEKKSFTKKLSQFSLFIKVIESIQSFLKKVIILCLD
jgi:hypothetical protein